MASIETLHNTEGPVTVELVDNHRHIVPDVRIETHTIVIDMRPDEAERVAGELLSAVESAHEYGDMGVRDQVDGIVDGLEDTEVTA